MKSSVHQHHKKKRSIIACTLLKMCRRRPKHAVQMMSALVISALLKLFLSFSFNLLMLAIGFFLGYATVLVDVHRVAKHSKLHDYGVQIQQKVDELDKLDVQYSHTCQQIRDIISQFNMHIAHEERLTLVMPVDCKSKIGKRMWASDSNK